MLELLEWIVDGGWNDPGSWVVLDRRVEEVIESWLYDIYDWCTRIIDGQQLPIKLGDYLGLCYV